MRFATECVAARLDPDLWTQPRLWTVDTAPPLDCGHSPASGLWTEPHLWAQPRRADALLWSTACP
eukprot:3974989-Prymnesium_polylepis.1